MDWKLLMERIFPGENPVFLDLGAQVGDFSWFFCVVWGNLPNCKIISVDPIPENVSAIKEKMSKFPEVNWVVEECAVSTEDKENVSFKYNIHGAALDGSLKLPRGEKEIFVTTKQISSICVNPSIIKVDIEGTEWDIMKDLLSLKSAKYLIIEFHEDDIHDLSYYLKMILDSGYKLIIGHTDLMNLEDGRSGYMVLEPPALINWHMVPAGVSEKKIFHVLASKV